MTRRRLVIGNWKMNGERRIVADLLATLSEGIAGQSQIDVGVCVPYPFLETAERALQGLPLALGAQDLSAHAAGAYTGEVSASMLANFGVRYVLVGHSERRVQHGEDDQIVRNKVFVALEAGLTPVVCVGETLEERESGRALDVILRQVLSVWMALSVDQRACCVLAYEPVWAIGTGRTASPAQAQAVHKSIRDRLRQESGAQVDGLRILYGGSVKPDNASELFTQSDIDGGLIGAASLSAKDFVAIVQA